MTQFAYNPSPKPNHKRNNPKRGNSTKFSPKTRRAIIERDNALCVRCGRLYHSIHHLTLASQGGRGEVTNGCCVCLECHNYAHSGKEGKEWFEDYRLTVLIPYYETREAQ